MLCLRCDKGTLRKARCTFKVPIRDEEVSVRTTGLRCDNCGWETQDIEGLAKLAHLAAEAYRKKHSLLTGSEIRSRRERLHLSQEGFADWLGVGIASVKRWEGSQVQDKAMDELIRLKTDPAALLDAAKAVRARLAASGEATAGKRQAKKKRSGVG